MNQSILFNDDLVFNAERNAWTFTGQFAGALIVIVINERHYPRNTMINDDFKFDCEDRVESWLKKYEPDEKNEIVIS